MGYPIILLNHLSTGFTQIYYDEKYCGTLEDVADTHSISQVLRRIIDFAGLEIEIREIKDGGKR